MVINLQDDIYCVCIPSFDTSTVYVCPNCNTSFILKTNNLVTIRIKNNEST